MTEQASSRQQAIREILAGRPVHTQDELRRMLKSRGFVATQATLSRDLVRLGVRRGHGAEGAIYELPEQSTRSGDPFDAVRGMVTAVVDNGQLVVVRTVPSAAPAVARVLDEAKLAMVLGTVAGDDTVFVAPANVREAGPLMRRLRALLLD